MSKFVITLNDTLEWSRGKRAAHAAHAALALYGIKYTHAIRVLNAKPRELDMCDSVLPAEYGRCGIVREYDSDAMTIKVVVKKSDTRDDTARMAVRMVIYLYTGDVATDFEIVSGDEYSTTHNDVVVRDQGRTENP